MLDHASYFNGSNPATCARSYGTDDRNILALKHLDHEVEIDGLCDVCQALSFHSFSDPTQPTHL